MADVKLSVSHDGPSQSFREEIANSLSHGAGLVAALVATPFLISDAMRKGNPAFLVGACVFAGTVLLLYLGSTLYHGLPPGRAKRAFRVVDHCAIYLLIAGTYTPFTLVTLNGPWGWSLFGVVWGLALLGIVQEIWFAKGARILSLVIYLLMGWVALVAVVPLIQALSWSGFAWLMAGGIIYTAGVVFYVYDARFRHFHGIWHLFVLAGSAVHYTAIVLYVA